MERKSSFGKSREGRKTSSGQNPSYEKLTYVEMQDILDQIEKMQNAMLAQINALNQAAMVVECVPDGDIVAVNPLLCQKLQYTPEQLVRQSLVLLLAAPNPSFVEAFDAALFWRGPLQLRSQNAENLDCEATLVPYRTAEGELQKMTLILFEPMVSPFAAQTLRALQQKYESRIHALEQQIIFLEIDAQGNVTSSNRPFQYISGYSPEALANQPFLKLLAEEEQEAMYALFWQNRAETPQQPTPWQGKLHFKTQLGGSFWLQVQIVPFFDLANDNLEMYQLIGTDITAHYVAQEELKAQIAQLLNKEKEYKETIEELKLVNQHLKTEEKNYTTQYQMLLQNAVVAETDATGVLLNVNEGFVKLTQYAREELLGQSHNLVASEYVSSEIFEQMWGTIRQGRKWHGVVKNKAKDGSFYWLNLTIAPEVNQENEPVKYHALGFDVTRQFIQEENLRSLLRQNQEMQAQLQRAIQGQPEKEAAFSQLERRYVALTRAINNAAIVSETNLAGDIIFANQAFEKISGYSQAELIGQNHRMLKSGHQPQKLFEELWQTITQGKIWRGLIKNKKKDGGFYWVLSTIMPEIGPEGKPQKYIAVRFDVTAQIEQQEKLQQMVEEITATEEELRQTTEELSATNEELAHTQLILQSRIAALNNAAIVSETNLAGDIIFANEAFEKISGYSQAELIGQNHRILKSGHQPQQLFEELWKTITQGKIWRGLIKNKKKDGSFYWVLSTITPEIGPEGKPQKYIAVRFDVTAQIEQEMQLDKLLQESLHREQELQKLANDLKDTNETLEQVQIALIGQVSAINNAAIVSETDLEGKITFANSQFINISGYSAEELIGQKHNIINSGYHDSSFFEEMWKTISRGAVWKGTIRNKAKDGSYYWVATTITPELGADGKPQKYIAVRFNITQEIEQEENLAQMLYFAREQEKALTASAQELKETVERLELTRGELEARIAITNQAALVSETDLKGIITFANEKFAKVSKYSVEELIGKPHNIVRHPDMPSQAFKEMWSTIGRGQIWQGVIKNRAKDGSPYWVYATVAPIMGANNKPAKYVSVRFDITEQVRQAEIIQEQLELSLSQQLELEKFQKELTDRMNVINQIAMVCELDNQGHFLTVNEKFAHLSGYSVQELVGQSHSLVFSRENLFLFHSWWEKIQSGKPWAGVLKNMRKDGEPFWVIASYAVLSAHGASSSRILCISFDISEQMRQEQALQKANELLRQSEQLLEKKVEARTLELAKAKEEAEQANQFKSRFIATMSHELRTPLNGILGYGQLLIDDPALPQEYKNRIKVINNSGQHLLSLINSVLDLSKIEAGMMELTPTVFNLNNLLRELFDLFWLRCQEKGISLNLEIEEETPEYVFGDEKKLKQCLINLVGNAVKFTEKGGITIWVKPLEPNTISFFVKDTGRGIPEEKIKDILKPFTQAQAHLNTDGGTGLGLSITHNFIQMMGGELEIESEIGVGSTFMFTLPLPQASGGGQEGSKGKKIIAAHFPEPIRVLLADDDPINRSLLKGYLEKFSFLVAEADNAEGALRLFQEQTPQVAIIDLNLPELKKIDLIEKIRLLSQESYIIGVTASAFGYNEKLLQEQGYDKVFLKPVYLFALLEAIGEHCDILFEYEEEPASADYEEKMTTTLDFATLRKELSENFVEEFESNFAIGNFDELASLVESLEAPSSIVAQFKLTAQKYIDNFDFSKIEELLGNIKN